MPLTNGWWLLLLRLWLLLLGLWLLLLLLGLWLLLLWLLLLSERCGLSLWLLDDGRCVLFGLMLKPIWTRPRHWRTASGAFERPNRRSRYSGSGEGESIRQVLVQGRVVRDVDDARFRRRRRRCRRYGACSRSPPHLHLHLTHR